MTEEQDEEIRQLVNTWLHAKKRVSVNQMLEAGNEMAFYLLELLEEENND